MGQCSKITFSYGFILKEGEIRKLLVALEALEGLDDDLTEGWGKTINTWLNSKDSGIRPYYFSAQNNRHEDLEKDQLELAVKFIGKDDVDLGHEYEAEIWGSENYGNKFVPILEPWADELYMNTAKEALRKLRSTAVMQKAGITIKPQWFSTLSIG
ncbi:hypothetical protein H0H81_007045 [Sphagnurus paluster]|uniref:Uncharacterized protein n=1 Tax=Sphagnurus paluster TaxID=117069 RepID=A0A9P7GNR2_9AGAR|nr:hypothetical protein H0H81_007045 [Sphagnurus paluster]